MNRPNARAMGLRPSRGLRFGYARVTMKPLATAYDELHHSWRMKVTREHRRREALLLGQFAASDTAGVRAAFGHLLAYLRGRGSMDGLQSIFLTGLHGLWLAGDRVMFDSGLEVWSNIGEADRNRRGEGTRTPILFYDRGHDLATFVTQERWDRISDAVLHGALGSGIGVGIRQGGPALASDGVLDWIGCVGSLTTMGAAAGGAVGAAVGSGAAGVGALPGGAAGGIVGGAAGLSFGIGFCTVIILDNASQEDLPKNEGPPISEADPNGGGITSGSAEASSGGKDTVLAGGGDEGGGDSGGNGDNSEPNQAETEGEIHSTLVYPVPDDLRGMGQRFAELVSTPNPETDSDLPKGRPGGAPPGPNPLLRGAATVALHGMPRMGSAGNLVRAGFMGAGLGGARSA